MKYYAFLYSRSLGEDYRWLIRPTGLSSNEIKLLRQLYDIFDDVKQEFGKDKVNPFFCISMSQITVLLELQLTEYRDKYDRVIYSMHGISVPHIYRRHLWFVFPWLLTSHRYILDAWRDIDFNQADSYFEKDSKELYFDLNSVGLLPKGNVSSNLVLGKTQIPFSQSGYDQIVQWMLSSHFFPVQIAFGATKSMIELHKGFDLISLKPLQSSKVALGESYTRSNLEHTNQLRGSHPPNMPSVSENNSSTLDDEDYHKGDPTDRFNPVSHPISRSETNSRPSGLLSFISSLFGSEKSIPRSEDIEDEDRKAK